jgi:hypothetical protein
MDNPLQPGDWFSVVAAPDDFGGVWYEVTHTTKRRVYLDCHMVDGSYENFGFELSAVLMNVQLNIWTRENLPKSQAPAICARCGQAGDHRGMQYYPLEQECRWW